MTYYIRDYNIPEDILHEYSRDLIAELFCNIFIDDNRYKCQVNIINAFQFPHKNVTFSGMWSLIHNGMAVTDVWFYCSIARVSQSRIDQNIKKIIHRFENGDLIPMQSRLSHGDESFPGIMP